MVFELTSFPERVFLQVSIRNEYPSGSWRRLSEVGACEGDLCRVAGRPRAVDYGRAGRSGQRSGGACEEKERAREWKQRAGVAGAQRNAAESVAEGSMSSDPGGKTGVEGDGYDLG